jgi:hypothetical protein
MLRQVTYRTAVNLILFTALWFIIGAIVMWSPVPGALGISEGFFIAWLFLFFFVLAATGASLTVAAWNGVFPLSENRGARRRAMLAAQQPPAWNRPQRPRGRIAPAEHAGTERSASGPRES